MITKLSIFLNGLLISLIMGSVFYFTRSNQQVADYFPTSVPTPLVSYQIESLGEYDFSVNGNFIVGDILYEDEYFISSLFSYSFHPSLDGETKNVTGVINTPVGSGKYPLVLMIRGYVDQQSYTSGMGTKNSSYKFAGSGFITLAPDFLGYAGSDSQANNIFEARFQTYTTVLSILENLDQIPSWDGKNIYIWAHSNGGQIALTCLTARGFSYPTVLWAPVSKPFPYSVLYYTDQSDDGGKLIRNELNKFEEVYDVDKFSFSNYFNLLNKSLSVQIHQGTDDDAVPYYWNVSLNRIFKEQEIDSELFLYTGDNHYLSKNWDLVISRNIDFFNSHLK